MELLALVIVAAVILAGRNPFDTTRGPHGGRASW